MPLFLREKDLNLFNTISQGLVEGVVETAVYLYKLAVSSMKEDDLYGDDINKVYYSPVTIYGLIAHDDEVTEYSEVGVDTNQTITANFQRDIIKTANVYPEIGDILEWNKSYYEIHDINENRLIAGNQNQDYNYTFQCKAHLTRKSKIQIEEFRSGNE